MQANQKELFAIKFADCMARLKSLGLVGEIAVNAGVVIVSTSSKGSASCFRKSIKNACKSTGAISTETRPQKGFYVFTIAA
jgi:hypothetical protein